MCEVMEQKYIKYVAMYLRKSRGDAETDLNKHKNILIQLCKENDWKFVEYEEIGSGDSIFMRPIFQKLLTDVENEIYDAVCVVDIDRLGRGDLGDQDRIKKAFSKSDTYVITPQQVYNLNNDDDEFVVDMKSFIARREYKQIVKRLTQGKKIGARLGMWTNGTPPFPYEYERYKAKYNEKGLVVNDEKLLTYRFIIDSVIKNGMTPKQIAIELNKQNIPSPRNTIWHSVTIYRLLLDETHLGKIISNKTKGDGHANKKPNAINSISIPKDQWVIVENCHESVKTQEEHEKILLFLNRLPYIAKRKPIEILPLSGLIKCGLCGHTMSISYREGRKNPEYIKPCWYKDAIGKKCGNSGIITKIIYPEIINQIIKQQKQLQYEIKNIDINDSKIQLDIKISELSKRLIDKNKALNRIQDAFESGVYSLNQFKDRKLKSENEILDIQKQINLLQIQQKQYDANIIQEKLHNVDIFLNKIQDNELSNENKNHLYKLIIDSIIWTRLGDNINMKINFK